MQVPNQDLKLLKQLLLYRRQLAGVAMSYNRMQKRATKLIA